MSRGGPLENGTCVDPSEAHVTRDGAGIPWTEQSDRRAGPCWADQAEKDSSASHPGAWLPRACNEVPCLGTSWFPNFNVTIILQ